MSTLSQGDTPTQLPNCIREAFLGIDAYKTAITLDLLFTLGYQSGQWITFKEAVNVCSPYTAIHIIREGLQHFTIPRKKLPQSRRGRPTFAYLIPDIETLKRQIVADWSRVTDELLLSDFRNGKSYRMALHRELIRRGNEESGGDGAAFSRKFLCDRLNVSPDTCRNYERELGIYVEARYHSRELKDRLSLFHVPETKEHNGKYLEVYTRHGKIRRFPAVRSIAGMYLKKGFDVWVKSRIINRYHPSYPFVSDEQMAHNQKMLGDLFA